VEVCFSPPCRHNRITWVAFCAARLACPFMSTRDKKFEYELVLDWFGTVHIGIASGLLSLSETWNDVSRYGSSTALKTVQQRRDSKRPRGSAVYQRRLVHTPKVAVYQGRFIHTPHETRRHCKSIEEDSSILQTENTATPKLLIS